MFLRFGSVHICYILFTFVASWRSSWLGTGFWVRSPTSTPTHALASSSQHRYNGSLTRDFQLKFFHESVPPGSSEYPVRTASIFFGDKHSFANSFANFREKKIEAAEQNTRYSGAWGTLIHEKT